MNNNIKNEVKKFLEKTEDNLKYFIDHSMGIAASIEDILKKKAMTQRELAERMNKKESEVSRWLSGSHNFTFETIAKIEEALGERLIFTKYDIEEQEQINYKDVYIYHNVYEDRGKIKISKEPSINTNVA
ncbi:helix-turn-helix domain-containing protein [Melioribacter sp. Ez-97]|uniref:helix-turn-helix domain-containing protein n=1 Tax=Melioribacter sp. Ez-97 TaxID=3423434 RepID=UPI003EDB5BB9